MTDVDKFHYARSNPGVIDAYYVHDGMPIKIGTATSQNTVEFATAAGDVYTTYLFCPSAGHSETSTRYSGIF